MPGPHMRPIRILVDSLADEDALNAQMTNARDIIARLNPDRFHVTTFFASKPDPRLVQRPATRLIPLPPRRQTIRILNEFVWGRHEIVFYLKPSPSAQLYLAMRPKWLDKRITIGMVESQSDLRNEPTVKPEQVRIWERTILRSDVLISNTASVRASLEKEYKLASEIVPTGIDTKFYTPAPDRVPNSRPRIMFVGALRPFKGPQLLLHAAARFREADFVIVGEGVMAAELQARARDQELTNVEFLRGVQPPALRELYRKSDIFLFPSHWEGSPKVILEAAACGLPVLARRDYQPETVVDRQTGYLGGDGGELLERLAELIANPELRMNLGRAGRLHSEKFDWDIITRQWEEVFERLVRRGGVAPA
jgi:glycosyltransferase involved in cell wall biosynthesis